MSGGLHDSVRESLGQSIVSGEVPAGSVLRMEQLESRFGVSRSVMREVIRVLVSMNLVEARRSVGVTVRAADDWNPFDPEVIRWRLAGPDRIRQLQYLGELRAGLEPIAAELAASRASPDDCGALTNHVVQMSVAARRGDNSALLWADIEFHRTLLTASGNPMFAGLSVVVAEVLRGRAEHHLVPESNAHPEIELHLAVATAIQGRDATGARAGMDSLLAEASHELLLAARREDPTFL